MKATRSRDGDGVFAARVGLGLRELDGTERAPDVSADVLRRLGECESMRGRPPFPRLALLAALLAITVTTTLFVMNRGGRAGGLGTQATSAQDPQDQVGPWRLVYDLSPAELQRHLANPEADVDKLLVDTVREIQRRLGALAVVTRGAGATVAIQFADAAAGDVAGARGMIESPGQLALRVVAEGDYLVDRVRFDLPKERKQLQAWLDAGGRERLQRDLRAIAEYQPASEFLRWFVHLVRPNAKKAGSWELRLADTSSVGASTVAAYAESEWNGGTIPADIQSRPVEHQFLVELLAVNMHEVHFCETDLESTAIVRTPIPDVSAGVGYRLRAAKAAAYAHLSEKYIGKCLAVIWNDEVLSAPQFQSKIPGVGRILPLSTAQADTMVRILTTPVAVPLRLLRSERDTRR